MERIILIGPRGSGKTTLGRLVAERSGRPFRDTDLVLEERIGESIAELVAREGWERFRDLEAEVLAEVLAVPGVVAATGGGMVLRGANRALMAGAGRVFYPKARVAVLVGRLSDDPDPTRRPALTDLSPEDEMARVLAEREPLYLDCVDHVLDGEAPPDELANRVLELMELPEKE